ncbi:MAG: C10 family peptidase [Bacteroides sp.]|nr:C10 family peptidase [Bacteroides sp.]
MRKSLTYAVTSLILTACAQNKDSVFQRMVFEPEHVSMTRTLDEALLIAQKVSDILDVTCTRSATRNVDRNNVHCLTQMDTRTSSGVDTLLYVTNYADEAGFAVVSANKSTNPLLAVVEEGTYETDTDNEGFASFMTMAEEYVSTTSVPLLPVPGFGETIKEFKYTYDTITTQVPPLVATRWGQTGPESQYTSNGYFGCTITAMAQVMSYFAYPKQLTITYPGASINSLTLDWDAIKLHNISHSYLTCTATDATHDAIGHLCRQLGHLAESKYLVNGTETYINKSVSAFRNLGFTTSDYVVYDADNLFMALDACNPSIAYGAHYDTDADSVVTAHSWIVDGYLSYKVTRKFWTRETTSFDWVCEDTYTYYTKYFHYNWGWNGKCNGYFLVDIFAPNRGYRYDNEEGWYENTSSWNFNYNVHYSSVSL